MKYGNRELMDIRMIGADSSLGPFVAKPLPSLSLLISLCPVLMRENNFTGFVDLHLEVGNKIISFASPRVSYLFPLRIDIQAVSFRRNPE